MVSRNSSRIIARPSGAEKKKGGRLVGQFAGICEHRSLFEGFVPKSGAPVFAFSKTGSELLLNVPTICYGIEVMPLEIWFRTSRSKSAGRRLEFGGWEPNRLVTLLKGELPLKKTAAGRSQILKLLTRVGGPPTRSRMLRI